MEINKQIVSMDEKAVCMSKRYKTRDGLDARIICVDVQPVVYIL